MENREILAVRPPETPTPDRLGAALDNSSVRASLPFRVFLYYCDQDFASFGFLQSSFCFCCTSIDGRDRVPNTTTSFPLVACRRETRYSIKKQQQQQQQQKGGPRMTKLACSSGLGARREKKTRKIKRDGNAGTVTVEDVEGDVGGGHVGRSTLVAAGVVGRRRRDGQQRRQRAVAQPHDRRRLDAAASRRRRLGLSPEERLSSAHSCSRWS